MNSVLFKFLDLENVGRMGIFLLFTCVQPHVGPPAVVTCVPPHVGPPAVDREQ